MSHRWKWLETAGPNEAAGKTPPVGFALGGSCLPMFLNLLCVKKTSQNLLSALKRCLLLESFLGPRLRTNNCPPVDRSAAACYLTACGYSSFDQACKFRSCVQFPFPFSSKYKPQMGNCRSILALMLHFSAFLWTTVCKLRAEGLSRSSILLPFTVSRTFLGPHRRCNVASRVQKFDARFDELPTMIKKMSASANFSAEMVVKISRLASRGKMEKEKKGCFLIQSLQEIIHMPG